MASIATLNVNLTAGTARFQKGMRAAKIEVKSLTNQLSAMKFAVANALVGGLQSLASGAIRSFVGNVKSAIDSIDQTNDLAERLGSTSRDLEALGYAAKLNGSSFEGMTAGIEKMTKALGDAGKQDLFASLGLDQAALRELGTLDQVKAIADAINRMPTAAERFYGATQIFGRGGAELLNTLALGSAGIDQLAREADALGLTISETQAGAVADMNDSLDKLGMLVSGAGRQVAAVLAPAVRDLAEATIQFAQNAHVFERYQQIVEVMGHTIYASTQLAKLAFRELEVVAMRVWARIYSRLADLPTPLRAAMGIDANVARASGQALNFGADILERNVRNDFTNWGSDFLGELDRIFSKHLGTRGSSAGGGPGGIYGPAPPVRMGASRLVDLAPRGTAMRDRLVRLGSPAALEVGSAAYRSQLIANARPWVKIEQTQRAQLVEDKQHTRLLTQIAAGLQDTEVVSLPR